MLRVILKNGDEFIAEGIIKAKSVYGVDLVGHDYVGVTFKDKKYSTCRIWRSDILMELEFKENIK